MDITGRLKGVLPKFTTKYWREDAMSGLVLGVESVPDSLASGLLAGVNPVAGFYSYLYGALGGALFSGTALLGVQGTGAMSIIVAEQNIGTDAGATKALVTLSILTGIVMILAGLLRVGVALRFVSKAVMTGFVTAVGINIILGQLGNFTGYSSKASNRLMKALDTVTHIGQLHFSTVVIGVATIALIIVLKRTLLGAMGLVVAVIASSAVAALVPGFREVKVISDSVKVPHSLPWLTLPDLGAVPGFILPALSLALVGLIQGAAVAAAYPNPNGKPVDPSQDFIGAGAGNIASGLFQGTPVGGSMSATALAVEAGARTRLTYVVTAGVMATVILVFGGLVGYVAMPALAGLLIYVGAESIDVANLKAVYGTGRVQQLAMLTTLVLTVIIPLQYSVLIGTFFSILLYVVRQSGHIVIKRIIFDDDGNPRETDPPEKLGSHEVVVLQHYGGLYFASSNAFEEQLPRITDDTDHSVVVLRTRGIDEVGSTVAGMFDLYIDQLRSANSKLVIVTNNEHFHRSLRTCGVLENMGPNNLYRSSEWLMKTTRRAAADAHKWVHNKPATSAAVPWEHRTKTEAELAGVADDQRDGDVGHNRHSDGDQE